MEFNLLADPEDIVREIRRCSREGAYVPLKELFNHPSKSVRDEVLKRTKVEDLKVWEDMYIPYILNNPESGHDFLRRVLRREMPKDARRDIKSAIISKLLLSENPPVSIVCFMLREVEELDPILFNALAMKVRSEKAFEAILLSKMATEASIIWQLRGELNLRSKEYSFGSPSSGIVETSDYIPWEAYYWLTKNSKIPTSGQRIGVNTLRSFRLGHKSLEMVPAYRRRRGQLTPEYYLRFYKKAFATDSDWKEVVTPISTPEQSSNINEMILSLIDTRDSGYQSQNGKFSDKEGEVVFEISDAGQKTIIEIAKEYPSTRDVLLKAMMKGVSLLSGENLHLFSHGLDFTAAFATPYAFSKDAAAFISFANECCSTEMKACPIWNSLYELRFYFDRKTRKSIFRALENELGGEFRAFSLPQRGTSVIEAGEQNIELLIDLVESEGYLHFSEKVRSFYTFVKNIP